MRSRYRKRPILASLSAKNRSKSPFPIGLVFSIKRDSFPPALEHYLPLRRLDLQTSFIRQQVCSASRAMIAMLQQQQQQQQQQLAMT